MPKISNRAIATPASPIRRLVPFAEAAKKRGTIVYHLNIGQPDIKTPKVGLDALRQADMEVVAYGPSAGTRSYREKLVEFYQRQNITTRTDQMIVTHGASEALLFTMMTCMDSGDELIVSEPFYANYNGFAKSVGAVIRPITTKIEHGYALPPIEELKKLVNSKTKAILICNPSNPTGYLYSEEELEALRQIVLEHDLYLIADEVYRDFCYDGAVHHSILNVEGLDAHTIVIDSVSKRYSACGARIGVMISRNAELIQTATKFAQARLSPSTVTQHLARGLVDTPDSYFDEVKTAYNARRILLMRRLSKMEGVICPSPKGAFYAFIQLPILDANHFCQWLLEEFNHEGSTVMLAPGAGFYSTQGLGKKEVRLAYVLNEEDLNKAMDCLEEALKVYPHRVANL